MATKTLKNGAIYDMDKKRIVALKPELAVVNTQITSETASEYQAKAQERKRELIAAGALAAVEDARSLSLYGSDAWIYEIGKAQAIKATTPDDPKSTDAARFLFTERGIAEARKQDDTAQAVATAAAAGAAVATVLERVLRDVRQAQERGAVEGRVVDVNE